MSRSNPGKPKPRTTRATAQIVCEGFTEEAFCKHLKGIYARDCGVLVAIHNARGGSPEEIIQTALHRRGFDRTAVLLDGDRPLAETWRKKAAAAGHHLLISTPCFEALLLEILDRPVPDTTAACKKAFETMLPGNSKYEARAYASLYPKTLLDSCRVQRLQALLDLFRPNPSPS